MTELKKVKCVVWDLDNTLWEGVLLESRGPMQLKEEASEVIRELDRRGVLQSVASKNDHEHAMSELQRLGLAEYFLYPQIHWGAKSGSVSAIAELLNIGLDTFAFFDDQPFERDEVTSVLNDVRCYPDSYLQDGVLKDEAFMPLHVTAESSQRRLMYLRDAERHVARENFEGVEDAFLKTLDLVLRVAPAREEDLLRAEELTIRTNQLNTTGITYSADELRDLTQSPSHQVLVAELSDTYGGYGVIGLVLLVQADDYWRIDLFLMSCRVMSRGVGGALLTLLRKAAASNEKQLQASFQHTERNRIMFVTYRFAGFEEADGVLVNNLDNIPPLPSYMKIEVGPDLGWLHHE